MSSLAQNKNLQTALIDLAKQEAAGAKGLLPRLSGAIFNPNVELLFSGPTLREFNYRIEMTPRESDEAKEIRNIIRFFKEGMAVRRTPQNLFLKAPNVFKIHYRYNTRDTDHPYINKIKGYCALTRCDVDYTPQNTYMTYSEDGSMISYSLNLSFTEVEPIYYDDYIEEGTNSMGY